MERFQTDYLRLMEPISTSYVTNPQTLEVYAHVNSSELDVVVLDTQKDFMAPDDAPVKRQTLSFSLYLLYLAQRKVQLGILKDCIHLIETKVEKTDENDDNAYTLNMKLEINMVGYYKTRYGYKKYSPNEYFRELQTPEPKEYNYVRNNYIINEIKEYVDSGDLKIKLGAYIALPLMGNEVGIKEIEQRLKEILVDKTVTKKTNVARPSWDQYFMSIAEMSATRSTCDRLSVGCVLVKDSKIIAQGYNGSISGHDHCDDVGHLMYENSCKRTVHAEMNAILQCTKSGASTDGCTAYVTHYPCPDCMKHLAQAGVAKIIYKEFYKHRYSNEFGSKIVIEQFKDSE